MGKEGTTGLMKGGKRLVKGKVRNEKGESDRPFKWNGMGSHSTSLVLPANFLFFQCKQNTWCVYMLNSSCKMSSLCVVCRMRCLPVPFLKLLVQEPLVF